MRRTWAALNERSEFAARPEHALLPHLIEWMVARTTHPDHGGFPTSPHPHTFVSHLTEVDNQILYFKLIHHASELLSQFRQILGADIDL